MRTLAAFIPEDRLSALLRGQPLPEQMEGSVLFVDISDYTRLVQGAELQLGPKRGAEEMTRRVNRLFAELITSVHQYGGVIVGFGGDALTCWFVEDDGLRAIACGLAMQHLMPDYARIHIPDLEPLTLKIKVTIATGKACRFVVGKPEIQQLDLLAGEAMTRLATVQPCAQPDGVVMEVALATRMGERLVWQQRHKPESGTDYALAKALRHGAEPAAITTPYEEPTPAIPNALLRPWLLPEVYGWLTNQSGAFLAEIRPVTVLFLRFAGLDFHTDDAVEQKLNAYLYAVQQTLDDYEGFLLKVTIDDKGSYALGAFGAPLAHEEQTHQALAAALELRTVTASFPFITEIRIGLAQGRLLAGAFGSAHRAAYDLLGPAANLANRVMMTAEPGQIIVTESIEQTSRSRYRFAFLGMKIFKGFEYLDPPTKIFALLQQVRPATETFSTRLVGRKDELARLGQWQQQAAGGRGQTIRLEGAAGVGKSHLRSEFAETCKAVGFTVMEGNCDSAHATTAYYPWQPVLLSLLGITDQEQAAAEQPAVTAALFEVIRTRLLALNPEWEVRLPMICEALQIPFQENATTMGASPHRRQASFFAVVIDLIRHHTENNPLLLVIEDAHWIDEASLLLTLAIDRVITNLPVLLLLVHRPIEPDRDQQMLFTEFTTMTGAAVMTLTELSATAMRMLVTNYLHGTPTRLLLSLLRALTQSNPFHVLELLNYLKEQQAVVHHATTQQWMLSSQLFEQLQRAHCLRIEGDEWLVDPDAPLTALDWEIPATLDAAVRARVDRLAVPHKLTLKSASVIGRIFETDILSAIQPELSKPDEVQGHLDLLAQRNFIYRQRTRQESAYAFAHHILQEITYDSLLEEQKSALHWEVARAFEKLRTEEVERIAFHYNRTPDQRKRLFYLDKAADRVRRAHANRTALIYYQEALQLGKNWKRLKGLIEVLHVLGQYEEAHVWLEELSTMPECPIFDLSYLWCEYYLAVNDYTQAEKAVQQALEAAQAQGELIEELRCLNRLGWIAWKNGGHYAVAEQYYRQALREIEGWAHYETAEADAVIDTLNSLGTLYRQQGQFDAAQSCYRQALRLSQEYKNRWLEARTLENLGSLAYHQREFGVALPHHQAALRICRLIGDRSGEGDSLYNQAAIYKDRGELKACQETLAEVEELRRATGDRWEQVNVCNELGILHQELGQLSTAEQYLRQGLAVAHQINDREGRAYLLSNLGLVLRDQGKLSESLAVLHEGLAFMEQAGNRHQVAFFHSYLATVSLLAGDRAQAFASAHQSLTIRQELGQRQRTADDLVTLALIHLAEADLAKALACIEPVWAIMQEYGGEGMEFPARAWFVCWQVFQATGDTLRAQEALRLSYDLIQHRTQKLGDPELRHSYLTGVAINRAIINVMETGSAASANS